jgi:hypothetical protein
MRQIGQPGSDLAAHWARRVALSPSKPSSANRSTGYSNVTPVYYQGSRYNQARGCYELIRKDDFNFFCLHRITKANPRSILNSGEVSVCSVEKHIRQMHSFLTALFNSIGQQINHAFRACPINAGVGDALAVFQSLRRVLSGAEFLRAALQVALDHQTENLP